LSEIAGNFDEIVRMNLPDLRSSSDRLASVPIVTSRTVLGQQQPVAGMSGTVSKTSVAQFRMPGYPLVLITTDVLQEGEDLHICSVATSSITASHGRRRRWSSATGASIASAQ